MTFGGGRIAMLGVLIGLAGCQSAAPPAETLAMPPPPTPARQVARAARPKRVDPACKPGTELTSERKEALFRQFAAQRDGAEPVEPGISGTRTAAACRTIRG